MLILCYHGESSNTFNAPFRDKKDGSGGGRRERETEETGDREMRHISMLILCFVQQLICLNPEEDTCTWLSTFLFEGFCLHARCCARSRQVLMVFSLILSGHYQTLFRDLFALTWSHSCSSPALLFDLWFGLWTCRSFNERDSHTLITII